MSDTPPANDNRAAPARPCPICRKPATRDDRPFCSKRCRDVDLNRWLSGAYAIPVAEADEDDLPPEGSEDSAP